MQAILKGLYFVVADMMAAGFMSGGDGEMDDDDKGGVNDDVVCDVKVFLVGGKDHGDVCFETKGDDDDDDDDVKIVLVVLLMI